jgi:hypothetical protein
MTLSCSNRLTRALTGVFDRPTRSPKAVIEMRPSTDSIESIFWSYSSIADPFVGISPKNNVFLVEYIHKTDNLGTIPKYVSLLSF